VNLYKGKDMSDIENMDDLITSARSRQKLSPLYTSPRDAEWKKQFIKEHGKDKDGAFRVAYRIDGKK
jgi:hypothetical protein